METRVCRRCGQEKPEEQFSFVKGAHGRIRLHYWCNACKRDYNARWMSARRRGRSTADRPACPRLPFAQAALPTALPPASPDSNP